MSQRNSEGKQTARERLRAEQQREKAAAKRRRTMKVSGIVVGVLVVAGAVGVTVASQGNGGGGDVQSAKPITVGKAGAASKLTVYEDFRCPACGQFENQYRGTVRQLEKAGKLKAEYHLVTLIDQNMGGSGSTKSANAAVCARDEGKFSQYHDVLFQSQPEEQDDAFGSNERLLDLAGKVDGLSSPAFEKCVRSGKYEKWVKASNEAFTKTKHRGTPTILLDGKDVYGNQSDPLTPDKLKKKVEARG
ncbi:DsbA family protein [Streptomyces iconiensis]|uniref:Thioredoxin domain-containing protein n=1 Tax=Streptomyces iconiensis TaxID=1384038 RepID=A0ABT6ZXS2_9ACTN|nr:thioredoxin domain-containing protein [Streptomyces iconiensis]MDJ1133859.1 thioredoxin domain-containing protein [Streptomyces iconiensis]